MSPTAPRKAFNPSLINVLPKQQLLKVVSVDLNASGDDEPLDDNVLRRKAAIMGKLNR